MKIKKGDNVMVIAGKNRGGSGKVLHALPKTEQLVIDGLNMRKRHVRPRRSGQKGEIIQKPAPLHISNVKIICSKCSQPTRIGYKITDTAKIRICKKCGADI